MSEQQVREETLKSIAINFLSNHYNYKLFRLSTLSIEQLFDEIDHAYGEDHYDPLTKEKLVGMRKLL